MFQYQQNHRAPWTQNLTSTQFWSKALDGYAPPPGTNSSTDVGNGYETTPQVQTDPAIQQEAELQQYPPQEDVDSHISVELRDGELWRQFSEVGTEMIVTKAGRRIFPGYRVRISGLQPDEMYCVMLDVVAMDSNRYKFQDGEWIVAGRGEHPIPQNYIFHDTSPACGKMLMKDIISFHKVKLTNSFGGRKEGGKFFLHSMHRYQLRVHVVRSDNRNNVHMQQIRTFVFPQTTFITVTAYQNTALSQLKIANNPFAKGFRPEGARGKKKSHPVGEPSHNTTYQPSKKYIISGPKSVSDLYSSHNAPTYMPNAISTGPAYQPLYMDNYQPQPIPASSVHAQPSYESQRVPHQTTVGPQGHPMFESRGAPIEILPQGQSSYESQCTTNPTPVSTEGNSPYGSHDILTSALESALQSPQALYQGSHLPTAACEEQTLTPLTSENLYAPEQSSYQYFDDILQQQSSSESYYPQARYIVDQEALFAPENSELPKEESYENYEALAQASSPKEVLQVEDFEDFNNAGNENISSIGTTAGAQFVEELNASLSPTSDDTGYISTSPAEFLSCEDVSQFLSKAIM